MDEPTCKMCGESTDFVDAHVVPRSFYPHRGRSQEGLLLLSSDPDERKKRSRTGLYDQRLVCGECERKFAPFDGYAAQLLLDRADEHREEVHGGDVVGYFVDEFDYSRLKLFALSMLWRAAASDREEFAKVSLGPFLPKLADMVRGADPGDPEDFAVVIARFSDVRPWESGFLSPFRERYGRITFYRFVAGKYVVYVKVDRQRAPDFMSKFVIRPGARLVMPAREFHGGPEFRAFHRIVKSRRGE